jgi:hypothetical protein
LPSIIVGALVPPWQDEPAHAPDPLLSKRGNTWFAQLTVQLVVT